MSEETNKPHQKHAKLSKPKFGSFGRNEMAIVGTTCENMKQLAQKIIQHFSTLKIAYADADHTDYKEPGATINTTFTTKGYLEYTDKIIFSRFDYSNPITSFQRQLFFNDPDLILVNGNHFPSTTQVVVIDPLKNLEKKIGQLTDVQLILLKEKDVVIPDNIKNLRGFNHIPIIAYDDINEIAAFIKKFLSDNNPPLNGLVLAGGQSSRMQKDKGNLHYHGVNQRKYLYDLLSKHCEKVHISCNAEQAAQMNDLPVIQDSFLHLGPMGGILSALQNNPNTAWLTLACDLPFLSEKTIEYLIKNRNPSKIATAFLDPQGEFPEPLVTIWEPKSYYVLLQFLAQGHSCPRKVLINSSIELLKAPDESEFLNVNYPKEYEQALKDLQTK